MSVRYPNDSVRVVEFDCLVGGGRDQPTAIFTQAAEWLRANSPVALVGVCLVYDGTDGNYTLQLAHTVADDATAAGAGGTT